MGKDRYGGGGGRTVWDERSVKRLRKINIVL